MAFGCANNTLVRSPNMTSSMAIYRAPFWGSDAAMLRSGLLTITGCQKAPPPEVPGLKTSERTPAEAKLAVVHKLLSVITGGQPR